MCPAMRLIAASLLLTSLFACSSCTDDPAQNTSTPPETANAAANATPGGAGCPPARTPDDWHMVDTLFATMGGVNGRMVADLFVGDGYYTMKLLEAGARVIAMDDDPNNLAALEARKKAMGICDERLVIRQATPGAPNLAANEVDIALCTRELLTIPDQAAYFRKLLPCIRSPHNLFVVNFLPEQTPMGPPMEQRMDEIAAMDIVGPGGFSDIGTYSKKLPYRFLMQAQVFAGEAGEVEAMPTGANNP